MKSRNILLIRLRLIGDVVFTTPAVRGIRRHLPTARLTYLVEPEAAPVVTGNPHLNEVIIAGRSRGAVRFVEDVRLARRLRSAGFDTAVDFHGGPRSSWLAWASGASVRIGYRVAGREWMYTHRVDRPRELRPRHSVENQWDLLAPLDERFEGPPDPRRDPLEMREDVNAAVRVEQRLVDAGIDRGRHALIVVHVSAGNPFRRWPFDSFVALIAALAASDRCRRIILTAGPSELEAVSRIGEAARLKLGPKASDAIARCGELDLPELHALVRRAALFIGGDSGPLHIAATTDVPIVGVYGPTLPVRSAPWRDPACVTESVDVGELPCRPCNQRVCAPGDFRCLTRLAPEDVIAAAERAIRRSKAPSLSH